MSSENRTAVPNSLNEHWMPFTSNKDFKANPRLITAAKGVYFEIFIRCKRHPMFI